MLKVGLIGAGKMGISHLSILGAHQDVEVVGISDTSRLIVDALQKYTPFPCFTDYHKMLEVTRPDAVFVAVPTKFHAMIIKELLERNIHVFSEKPFCLSPEDGLPLIDLARQRKVVNQVGYHNEFVGTFNEVKKIIDGGYLGTVTHFTGEAYGPVVLKKKQDTWRSDPMQGGGCLMDYASHVLDLIQYLLKPVKEVHGTLMKSIYSTAVDDAIYSLLKLENDVSGVLSVNWSDETYRKMSTTITIIGSKGKIISDANELKIYFKGTDHPAGYSRGWNIRNITDLTEPVNFNLRGEEYSAQVDYFINAVEGRVSNDRNTFQTSWFTDKAIDLIRKSSKLN
ncbi:MAG TPA: Gfo/Idh/MocA family oxidoreductase [Sphingobacteriaceae bacterium]